MTEKKCKKCMEHRPIEYFGKKKSSKDGLQYICKPCISIACAKEYALNPNKFRVRAAKYRMDNPEKYKQNSAAVAEWHSANPEKIKEYGAKWRAANPHKLKAWSASWARENPEARRIAEHNRRARKRETGGSLSKGLANRLFKLQGGKCACGCKRPLRNNYHIDHIMPLALGGKNIDDNIQLLRSTCNLQKCAKHPIQFMQERGFLI